MIFDLIKLNIWIVFDHNDNNKTPLTVCLRKKQALEYIIKQYKKEYFNQFLVWAVSNQLDVDDDSAWSEYVNSGNLSVDQLTKYSILRYKYTISDLVSFLRIVMGCEPLDCSFESEEEHAIYLKKNGEQ